MNETAYHALVSHLNDAVEILDRHRTPDPALIAAFDTLKQARAMLVQAVQHPEPAVTERYAEQAAA